MLKNFSNKGYSLTDLFSKIVSGASRPIRRSLDGMKMTALSAWAVDTLAKDGADAVEIEWAFEVPRIEISATFVDGRVFSATGSGRRDTAVMGAVSDILDDRLSANAQVPQWYEILGISSGATAFEVDKAYFNLIKQHHPDAGGDHEAMVLLNVARDAAKAERMAA